MSELNIGKAIKRLRREKDITQEELADAIGVTSQAVSKWEREEGYPDITLLPSIAGYFGVTVDTVCGLDAEREKEEIEEIISTAWKTPGYEAVDIFRKGLEKYPHSFKLKSELAYQLMVCTGQENLEEAIRIYEHILEKCTDTKIRNIDQANICTAYQRAGYHDKAVAMAKSLPNIYKTMEIELCDIVDGTERIDVVQDAVQRWTWCLYYWTREICKTDHYSPDEKIALCQKVIDMYELIYENHDHLYGLLRTLSTYQNMADLYLEKGDIENCLISLDKSADYCVMNDTFDLENGKATSLLINRITYKDWDKRNLNERSRLLEDLTTESRYAAIRDTPKFKAILDKLT
ncbi:MAG: helix-turn-helix transcriptional regulator [Clostridia bacterium]|nr:helix-turn-helix transcriptional regulator [Clostridia bacterium]